MDYRRLFGKLEQTLDRIDTVGAQPVTLSAILERIVVDLGEDLGLDGGRIYTREADQFVLREEYPRSTERIGFRLPVDYAPIRELLRQGFTLHEPDDPAVDLAIEGALGVGTFAAICVGTTQRSIVAFSLRHSSDREHVLYTLNTIRHVINLRLSQQRFKDRFAEARSIQLSLLPSSPPRFADYDIWAASIPAEEVGGDLYDFIEVSRRSLGLAIADSAGHGLPAALQARDAIVGLRMGVEERWRITATIEKLNKVVGRSALVSRFISLFYAEIEPNGTIVYCNAGHLPPLLYYDGRFDELHEGGAILGPNPEATYERGYARLLPGTIMLAYTDGITEALNAEGEMFEVERLRELIRRRPWSSARELVETVFAEVGAFSVDDPPTDDQTVLAVIRPAD